MILIHTRSPIQMGYPAKLQRWLLETEVAVLHTDVGREVSRNLQEAAMQRVQERVLP
jgi:hypothetical protein